MLRFGKLEISSGFILVAAVLFYLDDQGILPWALLACAIHEMGHFAAVKAVGGRVLCLRLTAVGGQMLLSSRRILSYGRELIAVLAGPAANLAAAFLAAALAGKGGETVLLFSGLNFVMGSFNLLPADPLDGGHAVRLMVSILWSPLTADRALRFLTWITALLLTAAGGFIFWKTKHNFTLLVVSAWMLLSAFRS